MCVFLWQHCTVLSVCPVIMTLLSAVVLGTDIFTLPLRDLPCTGAFVLMCAQVNACVQCSVQCSGKKITHSLVNDKSRRKVRSLKYYIIGHILKMEGYVLDIHAGILTYFAICSLQQAAAADKICLQKHISLICQQHKVCLQQRRAPKFTNWDAAFAKI